MGDIWQGNKGILGTVAGVGAAINPFDPVMGYANDKLNGTGGRDPNAPWPVDPRLGQIADAQAQQAQQFRSNIPQMSEAQGTAAADDTRRQLAGTVAGVRQNANSRGLLYSGLRQAGEANAGAQAASGLAQKQAGINNNLQGQATTLENQALQSGMGVRQLQQDQYNNAYQRALNAQQQKSQGQSSLLGGVGGIVGALI